MKRETFYDEYSGVSELMGSEKANPVSRIAYGYAAQVVIMDEICTVLTAHTAYCVDGYFRPKLPICDTMYKKEKNNHANHNKTYPF